MSLSTLLFVLVIVGAAAFAIRKFGGAWMRYRGARVVRCPENHALAGVSVDARHAAATALHPELRLSACSRWPENQGCGQECLNQIEAAPEDCLVRNILARWYAGKSCVYCGKSMDEIRWAERSPGLLSAEGRLLAWDALKPEEVPPALAGSKAVCFSCFTATSFAREHPDLVVNRGR